MTNLKMQQQDQEICKLMKLVSAGGLSGGGAKSLKKDVEGAVGRLPASHQASVERAFGIVKDYWHEASRPDPQEILNVVEALQILELYEFACKLFAWCVPSFEKMTIEEIETFIPPDVKCIDLWIKQSNANKADILAQIASSASAYYGSIWCDWYMQKAPIKDLEGLLVLLVEQTPRKMPLQTPSQLLSAVFERDKKCVLGPAILKIGSENAQYLKNIIRVCGPFPAIAEALARELGIMMAGEGTGGLQSIFRDSVIALVSSEDARVAHAASMFGAHVLTSWALLADPKDNGGETLQSLGTEVFFASRRGSDSRNLWMTARTDLVSEKIVEGSAKISVNAAEELAHALRASQKGVSR